MITDFKALTIPEGEVVKIEDSLGRVLWKKLPYDAELEYLGSDSHAYIDTGVSGGNDNLRIEGHFLYSILASYGAVFGNYINDYINGTRLILDGTQQRMLFNLNTICTTAGNTVVNAAKNVVHYFSSSKNSATIDSTTVNTNRYNSRSNTNNICVFNRSLTNPFPTDRDIGMQIYDFQIYDNDVLVLDFIPVRVGQVGYMYDKVSKQLFGNAGTGVFGLGPDKLAGTF